jgi:hypothetical protein
MKLSRLFAACTLATTLTISASAKPADSTPLFNGKDLTGWTYNDETKKKEVWGVENGILFVSGGGGGWLMTEKEYANFELTLEFKLSKVANSGIAIRSPLKGNPAYVGMELQIIDDENWKGLKETQHTASLYDIQGASKIVNKPIGEWNTAKVIANGVNLKVEINGQAVLETKLDAHTEKEKTHPGLKATTGHIGFQSHDNRVEFKNIVIKELK